MKRRLLITGIVVLLLTAMMTVIWLILEWPSPNLVLKYGFPPTGGPTGRTLTTEGVEFVEIGPGCFLMGSDSNGEPGDFLGGLCYPFGLPWGDQPNPSNEMPVHWVDFRRGFWIARTEVTNAQYGRFKPGHDRGPMTRDDLHPAAYVSWEDAKRYCTWLSDRSGRSIRLPSEAEWECACRAGTSGEFCVGDDASRLGEVANCNDDGPSPRGADIVASRRPNPWGLFDLHGNVWEWCADVHHCDYRGAPSDGQAWIAGPCTSDRVKRGGFWSSSAENCRSAARSRLSPFSIQPHVGIRPAFTLPEKE